MVTVFAVIFFPTIFLVRICVVESRLKVRRSLKIDGLECSLKKEKLRSFNVSYKTETAWNPYRFLIVMNQANFQWTWSHILDKFEWRVCDESTGYYAKVGKLCPPNRTGLSDIIFQKNNWLDACNGTHLKHLRVMRFRKLMGFTSPISFSFIRRTKRRLIWILKADLTKTN